jgi:hypothetical protein
VDADAAGSQAGQALWRRPLENILFLRHGSWHANEYLS